jgi:hypothetical protein
VLSTPNVECPTITRFTVTSATNVYSVLAGTSKLRTLGASNEESNETPVASVTVLSESTACDPRNDTPGAYFNAFFPDASHSSNKHVLILAVVEDAFPHAK